MRVKDILNFNTSKGRDLLARLDIPLRLANLRPGVLVIDVGCGRGEIIAQAAQHGNWAWMDRRLHRFGLKTVFFIHNVLPHEPRRFDSMLAHLALRQADGYITLTEREKQRLKDLFSGCSKPIFTIPLPVYQLGTNPPVSKKEARTQLGLAEERPIVLFLGLVRPYKGLHYLIEACGQLIDKPYPAFVGDCGRILGRSEYL